MARGPLRCRLLFSLLWLPAGMAVGSPGGGSQLPDHPAEGLVSGGLGAADSVETAESEGATPAKGEERPSSFYLRRGGLIIGKAAAESLDVETRYGRLQVPLNEILQVRFAKRISTELRKRIEEALRALGDSDFDTREEATTTLREIGAPARPFLKKAVRSDDEEVKSRAGAILEGLSKLGEETGASPGGGGGMEALRDVEDDEVVTKRFTIRGEILQESFRVASTYGTLEVARGDLVGIVLSDQGPVSKKLKVAGANTVPANWLDTKVSVPGGAVLSCRASGQLHVPNYNCSSGPEGTTRYSGTTFGNFPMLSLVGKIGKKGKPFLIGQQSKHKVSREGRLYIGVVPFRRSYAANGTYEVRVDSGR